MVSELLPPEVLPVTLVYPTNAEYVSALKSGSQKRFTEPRLQRLQFEKKGISLSVMTGGLAIVFKATDSVTSKRYALRCFKGDAVGRNERYSEISKFLTARKSQLPFIVDFEFHPNELIVKTADGLPVVLMQWVDGHLLKQWLYARSQDQDRSRVLRLAEKWRMLVATMRTHNFAHGDLQHGNVLITDHDEFILIDYDGMAVPALHGPDSPELGLPGYQHRERTSGKSNKLSADLDSFSAINIYLCLRAMAIDPQLIDRFGDHDEGLLFHPQDLEAPDRSPRFDQLKALRDPQLSSWIDKFKLLASGSLSRVPSLEQFLCDAAQIIKALDDADWEKALELVQSAELKALPDALIARIDQARFAVECRRKLKLAVDSGDEQRIADAWNEDVFRNYPAARDLAEYSRHAQRIVSLLAKFRDLTKRQCVNEAIDLWDKNRVLLDTRPSTQALKTEIDSWRKRVQLAERALHLLKIAETTLVPEIIQISEQLDSLGGHPQLSSSEDFVKAVKRNKAAKQLSELPLNVTADNDQAWVQAWDSSLFFGYAPVASSQARYLQSKDRRAGYDNVSAAISNPAAQSLQDEQKLTDFAKIVPPDYCPALSRRTTTAAGRTELVRNAAIACAANSAQKEADLATILTEVRKVAAESLLPARDLQRLVLAEKRIPILRQLTLLPSEETVDCDNRILALWINEELLQDCPEAAPFRPRYAKAQERKCLLADLRQAKVAGDEIRVCNIADHSLLAGFKFDVQTQQFIRQARQSADSVSMMLQQLAIDDQESFARQLDVSLLNRFWPRFNDYHQKIRGWMLSGVLKHGYIGLAVAPLGHAVRRMGPVVKIKWQFPTRVTDTCVVAFSSGPVKSGADLQTPGILLQQEIKLRTFEQAGSTCALPVSRFEGTSISVLAIVEICGERFYSAPLNLGKVPSS